MSKKIIVRKDGSIRVLVHSDEKPKLRVQKQFKNECDVNHIMKKYRATGELTHLARTQGVFADFSNIPDLHTALKAVSVASDAMAALPALIRLRFENDPSKLLAFMQDPKNYDEGVKIGLYEPKVVPTPSPALNDDDDSTTTTNPAQASKGKPQAKPNKNSTPPPAE